MRFRKHELSEVGIEIVDKTAITLRCTTCGTVFSPLLGEGGKLPQAFWLCPNGCNHTDTTRTCAHCGRLFIGRRRARYCSGACRQRAYRRRLTSKIS